MNNPASKNYLLVVSIFILTTNFLYSKSLSHHTDLQPTVCYRYTDWDPPTDARCTKEGNNSSGIPVFWCCGPR